MENVINQQKVPKTVGKFSLTTANMTKIAILSVIAFGIMLFDFPLPIFPPFLKIDLGDLPAIIGSISMGPVAGVFIQLIKNLLHFVIKSQTGGVGEIANFLIGSSLVVPIGIICANSKSLVKYICGAALGVFCMIIFACLLNYFFLIPFYATLFGKTVDYFVEMATAINANVVDFKTFIVLAVAPFNLLKGLMITILGYFLYRPLRKVI